MFASFKSRWTMPFRARRRGPRRYGSRSRARGWTESPRPARPIKRLPVDQLHVRKWTVPALPVLLRPSTVTMPGWSRAARALASRWNRAMRSGSRATSGGRISARRHVRACCQWRDKPRPFPQLRGVRAVRSDRGGRKETKRGSVGIGGRSKSSSCERSERLAKEEPAPEAANEVSVSEGGPATAVAPTRARSPMAPANQESRRRPPLIYTGRSRGWCAR